MPPPNPVEIRRETIILPTYEPHWPDRNPMFLEKRVYQGSSGRVYPLPVTDRIAERAVPRAWDAVWIENEYLRIMILPALGGRIHRAQDKTNGYDFIYHQPVIKPALVGLAGPWASGGIEFNWPQHHRPSTFMPADVGIENHADGSATVWLSEHDPMARMKGMHGVRLHPGRSCLELVARVYNRTADVQTFLWWANVATRVHEQYQSFFPPDTICVADHAKRAMSAFPLCTGRYYGVDYGGRARTGVPAGEVPRQFWPASATPISAPGGPGPVAANDLAWYANIPVPTSYMGLGSREDFCGGYDHRAQAGLVHVANHHLAPGKKQWTWGNHEFGYAWDRNLTEPDAHGEYPPYIELMSGVFTDNQPDFSFLQPGETKTWSQFWYPIRQIGPVQHATVEAALSLHVGHGVARIGVAVTSSRPDTTIRLERSGRRVGEWTQSILPGQPHVFETLVAPRARASEFTLRVIAADGTPLLNYTPPPEKTPAALPPAATEPAAPSAVPTSDELFLNGLHLEQYRHATRQPEDYWREALRRDPGDARCNLALGRWHFRRGERLEAERHLRASIARQTLRNPNPSDGEAYYQLGLCLRHAAIFGPPAAAGRGDSPEVRRGGPGPVPPAPEAGALVRARLLDEAYAAFYKATWNHAWQPAGYHALAEIDALRGNWTGALDHLDRALRVNADNLRARNLQTIALRQSGRPEAAAATVRANLALDPLDWWARHLGGEKLTCDWQVRLDLALDCIHAGQFAAALEVLAGDPSAPGDPAASPAGPPVARLPDASLGAAPLVSFYRAWLCHQRHDPRGERGHLAAAARASPDHCFPARLEEIAILEHAIAARPANARARFLLGHLLYDRRRHREAIAQWERVVRLEPRNAVAWRNLGLGRFNVLHQPAAARTAYDRAFRARPTDARLLYERDQLWKRLGVPPARRRRELLRHPRLVRARDDLALELGALHLQTGHVAPALALVSHRRFQPWEGGEGQALGLHVRTHLALGRRALAERNPAEAVAHFRLALTAPPNLGEARHLLANPSDVQYWLGRALAAAGDLAGARAAWAAAADFRGDFQGMSVRAYSAMTYYSALALQRLGRAAAARVLLRSLLAHARTLARTPATIDYFATSLPTMLLFDDDLAARQKNTARFLEAQARLGLGRKSAGRKLLRAVLRHDPGHAEARDLLAAD